MKADSPTTASFVPEFGFYLKISKTGKLAFTGICQLLAFLCRLKRSCL